MITADMVKELREKTGARLMDCKEALSATSGDSEKAIDWIKKKNLDTGGLTGSKPTLEGLLGHIESDGALTVVEMTASTDFATSSDGYKEMLRRVTDLVHASKFKSLEDLISSTLPVRKQIVEDVKATSGALGENIQIRRIVRAEGDYGYYIHFDNKQGAVVLLSGATGEAAQMIGKDIAMHVVFAKPEFLNRDNVPLEDEEREKAIIADRLKDDPKNANKPPAIIEKIVAGQLNKFYSRLVLVDQPYYKEDKKSVAQVLKNFGVQVGAFYRFQVGV